MTFPSTTPAQLTSDSVFEAREADVGRMRTSRMHARQAKLGLFVAAIAVWVVVRSMRGLWVLPAMPHIDWLLVAPFVFFLLLIAMIGAQFFFTGRSPHVVIRPEQIDISLDDVRGIDPVKDEVIRSLNLFLQHTTFEREMGGRARRGLLFEGGRARARPTPPRRWPAAGVPFLYASATSFQSGLQGATSARCARTSSRCASSPTRRAAPSASSTSSTPSAVPARA